MQKKLLAVAVAGVLAAPAVALAQSSVTISGVFKASLEGIKLNQSLKANTGETRLADDSSQIHFNVTEDLGGGMAAVGKLDLRFKYDDTGTLGTANVGGQVGAGNTYVGLRGKQWGMVLFGRHDLHYFNTESRLTGKGTLRADSTSLLSFIQGAPIANASRTQNVVRWLSPNWGGFTVIAAYSTNPTGNDNDIGSGGRKGRGIHFNPNLQGSNYQVGYSYWSAKPDIVPTAAVPAGFAFSTTTGLAVATAAVAATAAATNQRGDRLYGSYSWGGLRLGLAWDKSRLFSSAGGADAARRTAWSIPVEYVMGNHNFLMHYTKARDDQATAAQDGAKMIALTYGYDLSKRTMVGLTYAKITNDASATYNLFTSTSLGNASAAVAAGEDPRVIAATIRHAF